MRPRFFSQTNKLQLRADLQHQIEKHEVKVSVDTLMTQMKAEEEQRLYMQQQYHFQLQ